MGTLRGDLPPFAALIAFYAAATHPRYRDAAQSLGISESAISHQIRKIENFFQTRMFERSGGVNRLTDDGQRYLALIEPAIAQLRSASNAMRPSIGRHVVRLTLPPSLAATWLIPKLSGFEHQHPDIDLQVAATSRVVDLQRDQVDFAIRHGRGRWPGVHAQFLFAESAMPVCAPDYMPAILQDAELSDMTDDRLASLLQSARIIINGNVPDEWQEWSAARGISLPGLDQAIRLDSLDQVLTVAESGHGLALGRRPIVDKRLERGTLITPFGGPDPTGAAYFLCHAEKTEPTAPGKKLQRWLNNIAATVIDPST